MNSSHQKSFLVEVAAGWISLVFSEYGLCKLSLPVSFREEAEMRLFLKGMAPAPVETHKEAAACAEQLKRYFNGEIIDFGVRIDLRTLTEWQRKVLSACRSIPYGTLVSYKAHAEAAGNSAAGRAVGRVMALNPVPVIIPCHRVTAANGGLGGYSGGLEMKKKLLTLEGVIS